MDVHLAAENGNYGLLVINSLKSNRFQTIVRRCAASTSARLGGTRPGAGGRGGTFRDKTLSRTKLQHLALSIFQIFMAVFWYYQSVRL
jgi:hypothetical protein